VCYWELLYAIAHGFEKCCMPLHTKVAPTCPANICL